ncbi:MAG: metallophosphoesterase [Chloroflexi bacterium]|nr:metallophosphoesterase [Chloroflexota bacterium]
MRILTVSDKVEPVLYGPYIRERVGKIDLILACGDLPYYYLEYVVGLLDAPLYFVHGNHDKVVAQPEDDTPVGSQTAFTWAVNLHGRAARHEGLLLAGLEGCQMYNPGAPFQYTEADVRHQVFILSQRLRLNRLRYGRYLDILITHAPAAGIHDAEDLPHRGFESYLKLLRKFRPLLMIHGHQHVYNRCAVTETDLGGTRIINTYGYRVLELARRGDGKGWELVGGSR